jgi:hypothetical protein
MAHDWTCVPLFFTLDLPPPPTHSNNGAHDQEGPREEGHSHHGIAAPSSGEVLCRPARLYVLYNEAQRKKTGRPVKKVKPGWRQGQGFASQTVRRWG